MATITPQPVTVAGAAVTLAAATAGGDSLTTNGHTDIQLRIKNSSGASITVTLTGVIPCSQGSTHNQVYTVAAAAEQDFHVPGQCIDPTTGLVAITYSAATSVTVGATSDN